MKRPKYRKRGREWPGSKIMSKARFKPTLPDKSEVDRGAIRCPHDLASRGSLAGGNIEHLDQGLERPEIPNTKKYN